LKNLKPHPSTEWQQPDFNLFTTVLCRFIQLIFITLSEQLVYEWEQTLEELNLYLRPPPGVTSQMMSIEISTSHLKVGIKGADQNFLDVHFSSSSSSLSFFCASTIWQENVCQTKAFGHSVSFCFLFIDIFHFQ
jgi:hypothetical protein